MLIVSVISPLIITKVGLLLIVVTHSHTRPKTYMHTQAYIEKSRFIFIISFFHTAKKKKKKNAFLQS